jgi:hypothetical protein
MDAMRCNGLAAAAPLEKSSPGVMAGGRIELLNGLLALLPVVGCWDPLPGATPDYKTLQIRNSVQIQYRNMKCPCNAGTNQALL